MSEKLIAVARALAAAGVPKDQQVTEGAQRFKYRSAEAVMNLVGPILAEHGVLMTVVYDLVINEAISISRRGQGGTYQVDGRYVIVSCTITLHADGEQFVTRAYGEGRGTTDKAVPVAETVALRVALCSAFCIPYIGRAEEASEESGRDPALGQAKGAEHVDYATGEVMVVEPVNDDRDSFGLKNPAPIDRAYYEKRYAELWDAGDKAAIRAWYDTADDAGKDIIQEITKKYRKVAR